MEKKRYSNKEIREIKKARKMSVKDRKTYFSLLASKTDRKPSSINSKYSSIYRIPRKRVTRKRSIAKYKSYQASTPSTPSTNTLVLSFTSIEIDMTNKQLKITF